MVLNFINENNIVNYLIINFSPVICLFDLNIIFKLLVIFFLFLQLITKQAK